MNLAKWHFRPKKIRRKEGRKEKDGGEGRKEEKEGRKEEKEGRQAGRN
jgi:hypothetical protein